MYKIYWIIIILLYIVNNKCTTKNISCYEHGYLETFPANKTIIYCDEKCMENVCYLGYLAVGCKKYRPDNTSEHCIERRRGCDDGVHDFDKKCFGSYMKELRKNCSYDLCNDDKLQSTKCVIKLKNQKEATSEICRDGCTNTTCWEGQNTDTLYYGCYNGALCKCYGFECEGACKIRNGCRLPCFKDHCNDPMGNIITTTTTDAIATMTTKIKTTTQISGGDEIITFQHMGLRTINGWVRGKAEPFELTEMSREEDCGKSEGGRKDQISPDMAMKICVWKEANCTGGLTLCYRSQMSGIRNKINVLTKRTVPFHLDMAKDDNSIDKLCNQKELWKDWVKLRNHGFNLSSDGKSVEIQTSYDQRISMAKLNANGCAVLHFDRNRNTSVAAKNIIWILKGSDEVQQTGEDDDYEEEREETSSSAVVHSSTTTTLTDNATARNISNSNTTETAQSEQKKEEQEQTKGTSTDAERTSISDEEIEQVDPSLDKHFWSKLRGGVPLRSFNPLLGLAFDVLTGVGHDKPNLFAVKQDQEDGECQMRITFHGKCVDDCLTTTNLDDTLAGTDTVVID